jgi:hypothetical protein
MKDITKSYKRAGNTFGDASEEDREFLQQFSFICFLSFDVYVKKGIIEKIIDSMENKDEPGEKGKKK